MTEKPVPKVKIGDDNESKLVSHFLSASDDQAFKVRFLGFGPEKEMKDSKKNLSIKLIADFLKKLLAMEKSEVGKHKVAADHILEISVNTEFFRMFFYHGGIVEVVGVGYYKPSKRSCTDFHKNTRVIS